MADLNALTVDQVPEVFFRREFAKLGLDYTLKSTGGSTGTGQGDPFHYDLTAVVDEGDTAAAVQSVENIVAGVPGAVVTHAQSAVVPPENTLALETPPPPAPEPPTKIDGLRRVTVVFKAFCSQDALASLFDATVPRRPLKVRENRGGDVTAETYLTLAPVDGESVAEIELMARTLISETLSGCGYRCEIEEITSEPVDQSAV